MQAAAALQGVDPDVWHEIARRSGYEAIVTWPGSLGADGGREGDYDVTFVRHGNRPPRIPRRAGDAATALRHLTLVLGLYGDLSRGVETYHLTTLPSLDLPFRFWQRVLGGPPLPAAELERALRALDRIETSMPTAFDALRHQP